MRRIMFVLLLILTSLLIIVGCAKYELPSPEDPKYIVTQPVDADGGGAIDDKDIEILEERVNTCFQTRVLIYFTMADIEVKTAEDIWKEENTNILKNTLVVAEWERLTEGMKEWSELKAQLEVTERWVNGGSDERPVTTDFGVVGNLTNSASRLVANLADGRYILLTGVGIPTFASPYRKMVEDKFYEPYQEEGNQDRV